jgi:hypothetical protein
MISFDEMWQIAWAAKLYTDIVDTVIQTRSGCYNCAVIIFRSMGQVKLGSHSSLRILTGLWFTSLIVDLSTAGQEILELMCRPQQD